MLAERDVDDPDCTIRSISLVLVRESSEGFAVAVQGKGSRERICMNSSTLLKPNQRMEASSSTVRRDQLKPWLFIIVALTVTVVMLVLMGTGFLGSYARVYESWSGESLVALANGQDMDSSPIAPVSWLGNKPLTIHSRALVDGSRVEFKLRTNSRRVPVRLAVDGQPRARFRVGPTWKTYRVWLEKGGSRLQLDEAGTVRVPIHVARIKLTNVAGFMEGILNAWIVRRNATFQRAPWDGRLALFLIVMASPLFLLMWPKEAAWTKGLPVARWSQGVAFSAVVLAMGQLIALASGFRLILKPGTATVILATAGMAAYGHELVRRLSISSLRSTLVSRRLLERVAIWTVIAVWALALFVLVQGRFDGDLRGVARFGWKYPLPPAVADVPQLTRPGYDGQFYAILASDPLLHDRATIRGMDNPAYRAMRILLPLLAWISVGGSPRIAPFAYIVWCWILGLAGPLAVFGWTRKSRWRLVWFVALSFNAGLVVSMFRATPDAGAFTLILGALLLAERGTSPALTSVAETLAALARETSVLAIGGVLWPELVARRWKRSLMLVVPPVVALGSWRLYVGAMTQHDFGSAWTNFGIPFGWVPDKLLRLWAGGWAQQRIEWMGVAWVLLLLAVAATYLVHRRRPTPALITFMLFSALAAFLNMRVYREVNAYSRVLIGLPILATILAGGERLRWRRVLLISGVVLATIQGGLMFVMEARRAAHSLQHGGQLKTSTLTLGAYPLHVSGVTILPGAKWRIPDRRRVTLASIAGTRYVTLGVDSGNLEVRRQGRRILSLMAGESMTLAVRPGRRGVELVGLGDNGATLLPLAVSCSVPRANEDTILLPAVVGVNGFGASRWTTTLSIHNETGKPQPLELALLPRERDAKDPIWVRLALQPQHQLMLHDIVPRLFGVHTAGALLVTFSGPAPFLRCTIKRRTPMGFFSAEVPVLLSAEFARIQSAPWKIELPMGNGWDRASLVLVNPTAKRLNAGFELAPSTGPRCGTRVQLPPWGIRQCALPVSRRSAQLKVFASGTRGPVPVGLVSLINDSTGHFELHWPANTSGIVNTLSKARSARTADPQLPSRGQ